MFKEVLENEPKEKEFDEKVHKYGYITIVRLESVEKNLKKKNLMKRSTNTDILRFTLV